MTAVIETVAVQGIHEPGRVSDHDPAVAGDAFGTIGEVFVVEGVVGVRHGVFKHETADGVRHQMRLQPGQQRRPFRQSEKTPVPGDAGAEAAIRQRDDPAPPAMPHEVIGGRGAELAHVFHELRVQLAALEAVEAVHMAEAAPDGGGGVLALHAAQAAEFLGQHGGLAGGVDEPARGDRAHLPFLGHDFQRVRGRIFGERDGFDRGRTHQLAAEVTGFLEQVLDEDGAVQLEGGQPRLVARSDFGEIPYVIVRRLEKPHAQAVLLVVVCAEVVALMEHPGEEAACHFRGAFPHLAVKLQRALHDENAQVRLLAFEQQGGRCARKSAAHDDHIVICVRRDHVSKC